MLHLYESVLEQHGIFFGYKICPNMMGIQVGYNRRDFYICAPGSLALLIHPRALNFCSIFPTPLPETLITGHNGRCRRVKGLTVNSDEWGRADCVARWT